MTEQDKVDYSAQGQNILMNTYRQFIRPEYGIRRGCWAWSIRTL